MSFFKIYVFLVILLCSYPAFSSEKLYPFCPILGKSCGFINDSGNLIISTKYDSVRPFINGLASVKINEKWGVINSKSKWVVGPVWDKINVFSNGFSAVKKNNMWGLVNKSGDLVVKPRFLYLHGFVNNLFSATVKKSGFIDIKGKWAIEPTFDSSSIYELASLTAADELICENNAYQECLHNYDSWWKNRISTYYFTAYFKYGLAAVIDSVSEKKGYIDIHGKWIISPIFDEALNFSRSIATVAIKDKWGVINKRGKWVVNPIYDEITVYNNYITVSVDVNGISKQGLLDSAGRWIFEPNADEILLVTESLFSIKLNEKYGYMDINGNMVIQPKFEDALPFQNEMAPIKIGSMWGIIDKNGKLLIQPKYDSIRIIDDLFIITYKNRMGYLNSKGVPITFSYEEFYEKWK